VVRGVCAVASRTQRRGSRGGGKRALRGGKDRGGVACGAGGALGYASGTARCRARRGSVRTPRVGLASDSRRACLSVMAGPTRRAPTDRTSRRVARRAAGAAGA